MSPVKKFLPHVVSYLILLTIAFAFFKPAVVDGLVLQQSDNIQSKGMQSEIQIYKERTGEIPLWTNSMFSGMPTYQILYGYKSIFDNVFYLTILFQEKTTPHTGILLLMAGMYLLLVVLRCDWRIALIGAIAYGLSANFMDLVEAGHSTKILALGFTPPILAGAILVLRNSYILGGSIFTLALGLQVYSNHLQITYYTMLVLVLLGISFAIVSIKEKAFLAFGKATLILGLSASLAFGSNLGRLWTTYEYAKETIRGKSELTEKQSGATASNAGQSGLSKDYAFGWSYGILETYTLLIPNFMGGSSSENFVSNRNSATFKALQQLNNPQLANNLIPQATHYWGSQPFTGGPFYFGAIMWLLFFLGAFLSNSNLKPWLVGTTILTIVMAWGQNFSAFNFFLFDYLPFYNSFRAVTMALSLSTIMVIILGALGLQSLFDSKIDKSKKVRALLFSIGTISSLLLLGLIISVTSDFGVSADLTLPDIVAKAIKSDRSELLQKDLLRSTIFIGLASVLLFGYLRWRFAAILTVASILFLVLIDMWGIGRRFISEDDFVNPILISRLTEPRQVDIQIKQDLDIHYRVADFRQNPFNNAITSYHHKSIGGYHAAKLMRYQELIEKYLGNPGAYQHIYSMLNAKYFIVSNEQAQINADAYGNAWFVRDFEVVSSADEEFELLGTLNPRDKALINTQFENYVKDFTIQYDENASIRLTSYHPDTLTYTYSCDGEQLAIFSEIYYPQSKGWNIFIDGQQIPLIKADFLLRAARLPAGENKVVKMIFSPNSYYLGENVSLVVSMLSVLFCIIGLSYYLKTHTIPAASNLANFANVVLPSKKTTK